MTRRELICRSTLTIRGRDLDPHTVTAALGMEPDRAGKRGEPSFALNRDGTINYSRPTGYRHSTGSWQKKGGEILETQFVAEHLAHWCGLLRAHESQFRQWLLQGFRVGLSFYIDWAPTDFCVSAEAMRTLSDFGVELCFGVWPPECFSGALAGEQT